MEQLHKIKEIFNNPPSKYRSMPFWAWNDKLEPEEMRQQIQSMKENGVGGFFMHSREGLETEYMGTEWMECIRAAVDEAKKMACTLGCMTRIDGHLEQQGDSSSRKRRIQSKRIDYRDFE